MQIQQNTSLQPYNTFHINAIAKLFASFTSLEELNTLFLEEKSIAGERKLVLGGGSNILLTGDYNGLVLKNELRGISVTNEDDDHVYVRSAAGENWHQLVMHCIAHNFAGIENLALIPGNVGASPMQNIGAYGVELQDVFHELEAYDMIEKALVRFNKSDCMFAYRESIFKTKYNGRFIITSVTFRLNKHPQFNTTYGAIQQELNKMNVEKLNIAAVAQAVINIRQSKLPDPAIIGNAGSFFKNPTIPQVQFNQLKTTFPNIVGYPAGEEKIKVAAGWLIEQCGWKGYRVGDAGCHERQALVLVNFGSASGKEIYDLSTEILQSVVNKFGIQLEREVNII